MAFLRRPAVWWCLVPVLFAAILFYGCGGGGTGDDPIGPNTLSAHITGKVTAGGIVSSIGTIDPSIMAQVGGIASADVYLESMPTQYRTKTKTDGSFDLTPVPYGSHRLIAYYTSSTGKIYKIRSSGYVTVSESALNVSVNDLPVQMATGTAHGQLIDKNGAPIPNAELHLWGDTFYTNSQGYFVTPVMPPVATEIETKATGFQSITLPVTFGSPNPPTVVTTVPATGDTNRPPMVTLSASKNQVAANETINLTASATDPEGDTIKYFWDKTTGNLATQGSDLYAAWTAPSGNGTATISITASDSKGLYAKFSLDITYGSGGPASNSYPIVDIVATATTLSQNTTVTLTASATDFDGDALAYAWSVASGSLSSTTSRVVSWTAPSVTATTTVAVSVQVTDGRGGSGLDSVSFTIASGPVAPANNPPVVAISMPASDSLALPGRIEFKGSGNDIEDAGNLAPSPSTLYQWDLQPLAGPTFTIATGTDDFYFHIPFAGTYSITLTVLDSGGATGTASISFRINATPTVSITSPLPNKVFLASSAISFTGTATDIEDGALVASGVVIWWLDGTASITTGVTSFTYSEIPQGTHTIALQGIDIMGVQKTATLPLFINIAPSLSLVSPATGTTVASGQAVSFVASASDFENGVFNATGVAWAIQGSTTVWVGASFTKVLPPGATYTITLSASDSYGAQPATITFTLGANGNPFVSLLEPALANGSASFLYQYPATFTALASDTEDNPLPSNAITWYKGGALFKTGPTWTSVPSDFPTAGTYSMIVVATDSTNASYSFPFQVIFGSNNNPVITLVSPTGSPTYQFNAPISFSATAIDTEEGTIPSSGFSWLKSGAPFKSGVSAWTSVPADFPTTGTCSMSVVAADTKGGSSTFDFALFVNKPPVITFVGVATPTSAYLGSTSLTLKCEVNDEYETVPSGQISWYYGGGNLFKTGSNAFNFIDLPVAPGGATQTITIGASDTRGGASSMTFEIYVNAPASFAFTPTNGTFMVNEPVTFSATGVDPNDGNVFEVASVTWESYNQRTGPWVDLTSGTYSFSNTWTNSTDAGTHTILIQGTDEFGDPGSLSQYIYINATPTLAITVPASGTRFDTGASITFTGIATDVDTLGDTPLTVNWYSDATLMGSGLTLASSTIASGPHTIYMTVTDTFGSTATSSIPIFVNTLPVATITFTAPAQYATGPNNVPVFMYATSSVVSFTASNTDFEYNGPLPATGVAWWKDVGGVPTFLATGTSFQASFQNGPATLTVKLFDSWFSTNPTYASNSFTVSLRQWQAIQVATQTGPAETIDLDGANYYVVESATGLRKYTYTPGLPMVLVDSYPPGGPPSSFSNLISLAASGSKVYGLDKSSKSITVITNLATYPTSGVIPTGLNVPEAIAWNGVTYWVADSANSAVYKINPADGSTLATSHTSGFPPLQFNSTAGIRFLSNEFFVADSGNNRVLEFNSSSGLTSEVQPYYATDPRDIAVSTNYLFTCATSTGEITVFSRAGTHPLVSSFGGTGTALGQFTNPVSILFNNGDLFVVEGGGRVSVIRTGSSNLYNP